MELLRSSFYLLLVALTVEASRLTARAPVAASTSSRIQPFSKTLHGGLRIHGGYDAEPGDFPHQVALFVKTSGFFCSGGIISANWILTAGHCVDWTANDIEVRAGIYKLDQTGPEVQSRMTTAADRTIHPNYNMVYFDNDIALIKLPESLKLDQKLVIPARLPSYGDAAKDLTDLKVFIAGWGTIGDRNAATSNALQYRPTLVSEGSVCSEFYGNAYIGTKICVDTSNDVSTCSGDSGGAVVHEHHGHFHLVGVVSFGSSAGCAKRHPIVFTRVSSFLEFIETTTGIAIAA